MIRALRTWWTIRQARIAEYEIEYWQRGMDEAGRRFNEYAEKKKAAERRVNLLAQTIVDIRYPTKHLKGITQ